MKLSLSGRLVEINAAESALPVCDFLKLASSCGYDAVDLRWSQLNLDTADDIWKSTADYLDALKLELFACQYNGKLDNQEDEDNFYMFAANVRNLGGGLIRMSATDNVLKHACRIVNDLNMTIYCQMHTNSPCETIEGAADFCRKINEPNFAIAPEPANFALAGIPFDDNMLEPLRGFVAGVHVQTLVVANHGTNSLKLLDGREVKYSRVPYSQNNCIPFEKFFNALKNINFNGFVNELEPRPADGNFDAVAMEAAEFLRKF